MEIDLASFINAPEESSFFLSQGEQNMYEKLFFYHVLPRLYESGRLHLSLDRGIKEILAPLRSLGFITHNVGNFEALENARLGFLSIDWMDPETGNLKDLALVANKCREKDVLLHVAIEHALFKQPFDWQSLPIDFVSCTYKYKQSLKEYCGMYVRGIEVVHPSSIRENELESFISYLTQEKELAEIRGIEITLARDSFESQVLKGISKSRVIGEEKRCFDFSCLELPLIDTRALASLLEKEDLLVKIKAYQEKYLSVTFPMTITRDEVNRVVNRIVESYRKLVLMTGEKP